MTDDEHEVKVLWSLDYDPFYRNVTVSIHCDMPMSPEFVLAEIGRLVLDYKDRPEELFDSDTAKMIEPT